jgi:hypothetical protein
VRDHLLQVVADAPLEARRNVAREYLQVYLFRLLHEAGAFRLLAFVGTGPAAPSPASEVLRAERREDLRHLSPEAIEKLP